MRKYNLIAIGFVFSVSVSVIGMDPLSTDGVGQSSWKIIGDFSNVFNYGYDLPLNRQFRIVSNIPKSTIKEISVLGYKSNEIVISVSLRKKMVDVEKILLERNLMKPQTFDWDKNIWSCDMTKLPDFLTVFVDSNLLNDEIKNTILRKIDNEQPGEQQRLIYEKSLLESQQKAAKIAEVNRTGQTISLGAFTANKSKNIMQHHVGYTHANHQFPIIGSFGADPCVIMAVYNADTKSAALCHIDSLTELSSLTTIFSKLNNQNHLLEVHLAGGDDSSTDMVYEIIVKIQNTKNTTIKSADLGSSHFGGKSLAINSEDGQIYTNFEPRQLCQGDNFDMRMRLVEFQFSKSLLYNEPGL